MSWRQSRIPLVPALCALILIGSEVVLGQAPFFSADPVWTSGPTNETNCMAFGDVDGDGDLDLLCGNNFIGATLYENVNGNLTSAPVWSANPVIAEFANGVALGDIDGDGDLDLVCGDLVWERIIIYRNEGGVLGSSPEWTCNTGYATRSIALGDVDADGDLDLVCGNRGLDESNSLHENIGGTFSESPVWLSDSTDETMSIALGDVDGDGDLDLVCGNGSLRGRRNWLFLNLGDTFDTVPAWISSTEFSTWSVALGDMDGDGDLDLVCGNYGDNNTLYENIGGTFSAAPIWSSGTGHRTWGLTLGDVDGDGDLDLMCGNNLSYHTLYENVDGTLSSSPVWSSNDVDITTSVVLGDVDGDGDLDAAFANKDGNNTLYENTGGFFGPAPVWTSDSTSDTRSVVLGDMDGDEDLDLVCGNWEQRIELYENVNGVFASIPLWMSDSTNATRSVALGDMDGDGDLDLACGNFVQNDELYENVNGNLTADAVWRSLPQDRTYSVAFGDIDGDGDDDLVCGNSGQSNTLYENVAGTFNTQPAWSSAPENSTSSIALGDVDNDGDLDLVCGNDEDSNTIYENTGTTFGVNPVWVSGPKSRTRSVVLGDVDGDGDLDLVCGNYAQSNTLYENLGGTFDPVPSWFSGTSDMTTSVTLGDVDGDGDLDLVCGVRGDGNQVHENLGGTFNPIPVWSSSAEYYTNSVVLGDVDRDGDLDLACGNSIGIYTKEINTLYLGEKNPPFRGSLMALSNHLANNGAFLKHVSVNHVDENRCQVKFESYDAESDRLYVTGSYQFEGEPVWYPIDMIGGGNRFGPVAATPEGTPDSLEWDITGIPFDRRDVVLRLRITEIPRMVSTIQHASSYLANAGSIRPLRPELTSSTDMLLFSQTPLTVGDTASIDVVVSNSGTALLTVHAIDLPSVEMRSSALLPIILNPGREETVTVFLEPRYETGISGLMMLSSNDPITPVYAIPVDTDIRALDTRTKLLTQAEHIPLGEAVTVEVIPAPDVRVERGYLYYRSADREGAFQDSIRLAESEEEFIAVIPGESVTEAGLEYYIRVENSGVFSTDPPGAPHDSIFFQAVEQPAGIATSPYPSIGEEGREIIVQVVLPEGALFDHGMLRVRLGGGTIYDAFFDIELGDPLPFATIPGSLVGARGIEYWAEVQTLTRTLTDPRVDPSAHPRSIQVIVNNIEEQKTHTGERYRLLSVPLAMRGPIMGSISDDIGGADDTRWRMFAFDTEAQVYRELPDEEGGLTSFEQGRGYWLITKDAHRIDTGPDQGETAATDRPFEITLRPGHNLIGTPFNFPVAWDSMVVDTIPMAEAEGVDVDPPVRWDENNGYQYNVERLDPFDGYWVYNRTDSDIILYILPREAIDQPEPMTKEQIVTEVDWSLRLRAESAGITDACNIAGISPSSERGLDRMDRMEAPPLPEGGLSLYFISDHDKEPSKLSVDMRSSSEGDPDWGEIWAFDVAKDSGDDAMTIHVEGIDAIPQHLAVLLLDLTLDRSVALRETSEYTLYMRSREFVSSEKEARFRLIVGTDSYVASEAKRLLEVPSQTALYQNIPNPFNPGTIIRYEIADKGPVQLRIYNVQGALVKVLEDRHREPGRYEVRWNGEDEGGQQIGSGVYFYRLTAPGFKQTKKMVMLK